MVSHTLGTVTQLRERLSASSAYASSWTLDTSALLRVLEDATRQVEAYCKGGQFGPVTTSLTYDLNGSINGIINDPRPFNQIDPRRGSLGTPWIISLSSVTLYENTARDSSTAISSSDYLLFPYNTVGFSEAPFYGLKFKDSGSNSPFSKTGQQVLVLEGDLGWSDQKSADTAITAADSSTTAVTCVSSSNLSAGMTILAGSERLYIQSVTDSTNLVCARAVAGSVGAAHTSATCSVYSYDAAPVEAALSLASSAYISRMSGMQDTTEIAGASYSFISGEQKSTLKQVGSYSSHSYTSGVIF